MAMITTIFPWIVTGLALLGALVTVVRTFDRKADRRELQDAMRCLKTSLDTKKSKEDCVEVYANWAKERTEIWKEIGANRRDIKALLEVKGEMQAYTRTLQTLLERFVKMNGNGRGK